MPLSKCLCGELSEADCMCAFFDDEDGYVDRDNDDDYLSVGDWDFIPDPDEEHEWGEIDDEDLR